MHAVVFIPGLMGTELINANEETVWPPTAFEFVRGYRRINKLLGEDIRPGKVIETVVSCKDIYGSLLAYFAELEFKQSDVDKRLYLFPYDWRLDLEISAAGYRDFLGQIAVDGAEKITMVGHSMGGVISRLALENPENTGDDWLAKVDKFIALAVPQKGAPIALGRMLGLDSALGISAADFKTLGNDARYPSGYQLLPGPGQDAIWDQSQGGVESLDIFDEAVAERLGLDLALLERKKFVDRLLDIDKKPAHVPYFHFAGTGHKTVTRINIVETPSGKLEPSNFRMTETPSAGDGTVPLLSALDRVHQHQTVVNEHTEVFRGTPFKRVFFRLFGVDIGLALRGPGERPIVNVSCPDLVFDVDQDFSAVVSVDDHPGRVVGQLVLESLDETGKAARQGIVTAIDQELEENAHHTCHVQGINKPGLYRITFEGDGKMRTAAEFAVVRFSNRP